MFLKITHPLVLDNTKNFKNIYCFFAGVALKFEAKIKVYLGYKSKEIFVTIFIL